MDETTKKTSQRALSFVHPFCSRPNKRMLVPEVNGWRPGERKMLLQEDGRQRPLTGWNTGMQQTGRSSLFGPLILLFFIAAHREATCQRDRSSTDRT